MVAPRTEAKAKAAAAAEKGGRESCATLSVCLSVCLSACLCVCVCVRVSNQFIAAISLSAAFMPLVALQVSCCLIALQASAQFHEFVFHVAFSLCHHQHPLESQHRRRCSCCCCRCRCCFLPSADIACCQTKLSKPRVTVISYLCFIVVVPGLLCVFLCVCVCAINPHALTHLSHCDSGSTLQLKA